MNVIYTAAEFLVCDHGGIVQASPDRHSLVQQVVELKVFTKHPRKTCIYKSQAKHYLPLASPTHVQ